jgi:hypothetical protein
MRNPKELLTERQLLFALVSSIMLSFDHFDDWFQMNLVCKTTFRDSAQRRNPSKETWDAMTKHHWVHRWKLEGRCRQCSKSFQQKMFRDKVIFARRNEQLMLEFGVVPPYCRTLFSVPFDGRENSSEKAVFVEAVQFPVVFQWTYGIFENMEWNTARGSVLNGKRYSIQA